MPLMGTLARLSMNLAFKVKYNLYNMILINIKPTTSSCDLLVGEKLSELDLPKYFAYIQFFMCDVRFQGLLLNRLILHSADFRNNPVHIGISLQLFSINGIVK